MPVWSVFASASAFMCATMRRVPSSASVTTAVMSPWESKRGVKAVPSSSSDLSEEGGGKRSSAIASPPSAIARIADHRHEAHLLLRLLEDAGEGGREGGGSLLLNAAHGHA